MDCAGSTKLNGKCRIDRPRKASNNKKVPHKVKDLNPSEMNEVLNDANLSINCYSHSFPKLRNRDHLYYFLLGALYLAAFAPALVIAAVIVLVEISSSA